MSSFFKKVNHVGIVVKKLEEVLSSYSEGIGIKIKRIVEIPDVQLKIGVINLRNMEIEFLEYENHELPIVKSLKGDRMGLNHVCFEVDKFEDAIKKLEKIGFKLIEGFPRKGIHGRIAFFIPPYSADERIEILEMEVEDE